MTASTIQTEPVDKDILKEIPDQDLPLLQTAYESYREQFPQVYALTKNCLNWKRGNQNSVNFSVYCICEDNWVETGTFVFVWEYTSSNIFVASLQEDLKTLRLALFKTNRIKWTQKRIWFLVPNNCMAIVADVLDELRLPRCKLFDAALWRLEKETALQFEIEYPSDIYIKKLDKTHAAMADKYWGHKHAGSLEYLTALIDMNTAFGMFLKSDDSLVCWVLRNHYGLLCNLQTVPEHARKGYATLIIKAVAKDIAKNENSPICCIIMQGNTLSENCFGKVGFKKNDDCMFVESI